MLRDIYLVKDLSDLAVFVDQKSLAVRAHVRFSVHALFSPDAVFFDDILVCIGNERIWQIKFRDEFLVRLFVVDRDAYDGNVFLVKFVARITERTRFFGSARCVVFWIEPKHDAFPAKVL